MLINQLSLHLERFVSFNDEEFYNLCLDNDELKFERDKTGKIWIMPNTGGKTGIRNFKLIGQLYIWNEKYKLGEAFDSSTAFKLPNSAVRSPDVAWIRNDRWQLLTEQEKTQFPPICPNFVIELMSASDGLKAALAKMEEWIENGCQLAWLINMDTQKNWIFKANQVLEERQDFSQKLNGEEILPNFELDLNTLA